MRSRGRWLIVARMAWMALALVTTGLFAAALPARYEQLRVVSPHAAVTAGQLTPAAASALVQLGLSVNFYAAYFIALEILIGAVFAVVGSVIAWQRADDWTALFVALTLTTLGPAGTPVILVLGEQHAAWRAIIDILRAFAWGCAIIFCFLFPNGRFVPVWTRPLSLIWLLCMLGGLFVPAFRPPISVVTVKTPTEIFRIVWFFAWMGICVYAQSYRYRRVSNLIQRQQTKWIVFGCLVMFLLLLVVVLPPLVATTLRETTAVGMLYRLVGITLVVLGILLIPTTIGISVLRYRLFEVDVLINRTLVYGSLTVTVGVMYWGSVVLLQQLFRWFIGESNVLAIVASTLAIATLFQPLRWSIQGRIDRRLYRRKYDAVQALQRFSVRMRDKVDLDLLNDDLLAVVEQTVQPTQVSLWLCDAPARRRIDGPS